MTMLRTGILQDCGIEITFPAEWAANPTSSSATSTSNSAASAPSAPSVPAPESTPGVGGKYKDGWGGGDIIDLVVAADGAATATWPGAKYKEKGTLKGSILEGMMSLTAEFSDGVLRWSNGSTWTRLASAEASAPAAAAPAGASEAAASRQDGWGAAAQPQSAEEAWGGAAGAPAAGAWAGGSNLSATATAFEPAGFCAQPDDGADGGWKDKSGEGRPPPLAPPKFGAAAASGNTPSPAGWGDGWGSCVPAQGRPPPPPPPKFGAAAAAGGAAVPPSHAVVVGPAAVGRAEAQVAAPPRLAGSVAGAGPGTASLDALYRKCRSARWLDGIAEDGTADEG
mmetsp:Transcript_50032/g.161909  ORF Transcript_50032/g.161909 Transcript_50032/m.161909 type:complete len:339 (-) Transcript_50032:317-1333(-)